MEPFPLQFFAAACNATLRAARPETPVHRISTDTRSLQPGDLFVAISGDRFDGHQYVEAAIQRGAVAAVVSDRHADRYRGLPLVVTTDPRRALGRMASRYRSQFRIPVAAIAGSNGKTSTKEILAAILGECFETLRSPESFNNDIGVPLTIFGLEQRHVAAVIEVGTNHPGELAPLLRIAQPRLGVLTHIGEEHLEYFGSVAGVIEEEGWIADLLPPDGVLVMPGDQPWSDAIASRCRARIIRVGYGARSQWRCLEVDSDADGSTFTVRAPNPDLSGEYRVNLLGRHQVSNALLAIAAAAEFGLGRTEIQRGLARALPAKWRMNRWQLDGVEVLEDCYNANLDSMLAALETLRQFPCPGRRVAVLGAMAELGGHASRAHAAVGRRAAELRLDRLVGIGDAASLTVEVAAEHGLGQAVSFDSLETAALALRSYLRPGDCLLIKGSRSARLERLGSLLREPSCLQHAA